MAPHHWEWTGPDGRHYDVFDFPFTDTDGSKLILEMGIDITDRKRAEEELRAKSLYARSLIEASLDPLVTISADGKITDVNQATEVVTGSCRNDLIGSDFSDYFTEPERAREGYQKVFSEGTVRDFPLAIRHRSGQITDVLYHATTYRNEAGGIEGVFAAARDVTEHNAIERRTYATHALLDAFSKLSVRKDYLDAVVYLLRDWSRCRCVGIRVLNEQRAIPYESYTGFSEDFWRSENRISLDRDQCACIRVFKGNSDLQNSFLITTAGSFLCGNMLAFFGKLSMEERVKFRGVCVQAGFKSLAVIPIRYRNEVIGAIHLADEKEDMFSTETINFIESMTPLIGEAVNRFKLEEELRKSEYRLKLLSSQLLTVQENERRHIAREIHDSIGQTLSAIKFTVENLLQETPKHSSKEKTERLRSLIPLIQQGVEESRRIQMDLRPSILDDLGILSTISWSCREFQKTYSQIYIESQIHIQENEVPDSLKTVIYRIIQEALNNISKHSKAYLVSLSLKKREGVIELTIEDNGHGFDLRAALSQESSKRGMGLESMRERAELSGGFFEMESIKGKGTAIRVIWKV